MKENSLKRKVLLLLKDSDDYISGEELSQILGITRSAIWKYIKALRNDGYVINSVTNRGYKLIDSSCVINDVELKNGLNTKWLGNNILYFDSIDSTNTEIKRVAQENAPHGTVAFAEEQLSGKGRLGRVWSSPKGSGLWFSFLLRPEIAPSQVAGITLAVGLGVCKAIRSYTGLEAKIKWPNDVIVENKKVCGILTEMTAETDRVNYVVVGVGINVNTKEFPYEIQHKATSLAIKKGMDIDRIKLFQNILECVEVYMDSYFVNLEASIIDEYTSLCATLERNVDVIRGKQKITGKAVRIGEFGDLIVRLENGQEVSINSGEVTVQGIY